MKIPPQYFIIDYAYFQHAGARYNGTGELRYHMVIIPDDINLKDAISEAFGCSLRRKGQRVPVTTSQSSSSKSCLGHIDRGPDERGDGCEEKQQNIDYWGMEDVEKPQFGWKFLLHRIYICLPSMSKIISTCVLQ